MPKRDLVFNIDLDGTGLDLVGSLRARVESILGEQGIESQFPVHIDRWDFTNVDHPETKAAIREAFRHPEAFFDLRVYDGFVDAVERLRKIGHVRIATSPRWDNPYSLLGKLDAIDTLFPGLTRHLVLLSDKTTLLGHVLVDDKPDITGICVPSWTQVFYTQAYNAKLPGPRITEWSDEAVDYIVEIAEQNAISATFHLAKSGVPA